MEHTLGIDTSSIELGIGLVSGGRPVMAVSRYLRNSHAEHISQAVDYLLAANKVKPLEISHAAIAVGPGSFTGLRIGIAFLKGFFFGRDGRVLPVSSLESMAGAWPAQEARIVCASDARNGQVFWARFEKRNGIVARLSDDVLSPVDEFKQAVSNNDIVITDTLGYAKSAAFNFLRGRTSVFPVEEFPLQRGLSCATIAGLRADDSAGWTTADHIVPRYLSEVQAEKKRTVQTP
ncbi:MAG TPA: tRNA (adenosine(37)-N6)-threonylcarbamoyltransferase complex dimerization subunit type 1 TsaB [Chitinivibrionales bacterium]|jgi:tRNA threonylcarbamoyladenosine biosynthesis protein TsaB|nr:tRNA (adenosine(37)-N6)-threonylcarbamoyltransferase complex dimerization subunit type 1 TsaB [Chitinivibrionales bacterium]